MAVYGFDENKDKVEIFPVGSIYMSVSPVNPGDLFGGIWERFAVGRTLIGVDTAQTEFDTVEKTGGEKTHIHTTGNHILSVNEIPAHTHSYNIRSSDGGVGILPEVLSKSTSLTMQTGSTGGGQAHNHGSTGEASSLPSYITCYIWKRIE